ncbi:hypothetical protein [Caudoviricetes sp.]|nr:hypothetical protein [Caudoviricetes sp.]UOF79650.1 hypothetical protein [Caudoviricetes sp.]UOF79875.1 hypothetical protein [Bacteriophage sp.]UOF81321.1 hypothetical protein [Caudoviricetes sp.]
MATISKTKIETGKLAHWSWAGFAASADVGEAVPIPDHAVITIQSHGTYTGSLALTFEGSLEDSSPSNFFQLTDQAGTVISHTAADGTLVAENVKWIRPRATAGSGGASVTAYMLAVRK